MLSVDIAYNGSTVTKFLSIRVDDCYPEPPYCPPGQICAEVVQRRSNSSSGTNAQAYDVYPNPANNKLTVALSAEQQPATILITDLLGRRVLAQPVAPGQQQVELDVSALPPGTFLMSIFGTKKATNKRFQITR